MRLYLTRGAISGRWAGQKRPGAPDMAVQVRKPSAAALWAKGARALPTTRRCGDCDICCSAAGVEEPGLSKEPGERCPHQLAKPGHSCAIYADRPPSCSEFVCVWRASDQAVPRRFWPARAGWVMSVGDWTQTPLVLTVHPDPARPDAWDTPEYRAFFSETAAKANAIVAVGQGRLAQCLFAPSGAVYPRADFPELFVNGGLQVGIPDYDFAPFTEPALIRMGRWLQGMTA